MRAKEAYWAAGGDKALVPKKHYKKTPLPPDWLVLKASADVMAPGSTAHDFKLIGILAAAAVQQHGSVLIVPFTDKDKTLHWLVLPVGKEQCDEAAFTWPSQGLLKVAGSSAKLPSLQTGGHKLCHCSKDDARCYQIDIAWANLAVTLLAVQASPSPPSVLPPPSLLADGDATVPLEVLVAVIAVVVVAVVAGVLGAMWFRRRQRQVKRPRPSSVETFLSVHIATTKSSHSSAASSRSSRRT